MAYDPSSGSGPVANINVTPLVDVMLVLLVIFMVTAPMLQQGVDVNLPKAATGQLEGKDEQVVISIDNQGRVFVGAGNEVQVPELGKKIKAILENKPKAENKVYIKGDTAINYGRIMEVMSALHQGGVSQIGLVSELPAEKKK